MKTFAPGENLRVAAEGVRTAIEGAGHHLENCEICPLIAKGAQVACYDHPRHIRRVAAAIQILHYYSGRPIDPERAEIFLITRGEN